MEKEIVKRDRNDNRIKQRKAGERDISSNEDPSSELTWSGDEPSAAVDWSDMSGSSTPSPPHAVEVTSSRWPEPVACEKNVGLSSRLAARPVRGEQQVGHPRTAPGGSGTPEARRDPPRRDDLQRRSEEWAAPSRHLFDGSDRPDSDSLQRRPSRARSTSSALTLSAPQEADPGAAPRRFQSLIIRGGGALDVQVSLTAGRGQGPSLSAAEVRRTIPEQPGAHSATLLTDKRRIHLRPASIRTYTFFTTGFPRFLSICGARGLQAFDLLLLTNLPKPYL
jgi:hypothetical protein